jgi:hypothetical protein
MRSSAPTFASRSTSSTARICPGLMPPITTPPVPGAKAVSITSMSNDT